MAYATANHTEKGAIPIVDLTDLRSGKDPDSVAAALHTASKNLGFIYVKSHGISPAVIEAAREAAFEFFHLDDAKKLAVKVSAQHRGWLKPGAAKMAENAKPDLKESFIWGYDYSENSGATDHPLRGPNQWPSEIPQLMQAAMDYFEAAHEVAFHLMKGFARGLNLPENFFLTTCEAPLSRASFVYYPPQPETSGVEQFGVAPHTDFGVLTVLCQDAIGGLQVEDKDGNWIHAPPIEGTLVINVGDLLSRWTGGEYKSTPHRVVNASGNERLSLVLAFDPDPHTVIDANEIPGVKATEEKITCGDYLQWRFAKAFSYRNAKR